MATVRASTLPQVAAREVIHEKILPSAFCLLPSAFCLLPIAGMFVGCSGTTSEIDLVSAQVRVAPSEGLLELGVQDVTLSRNEKATLVKLLDAESAVIAPIRVETRQTSILVGGHKPGDHEHDGDSTPHVHEDQQYKQDMWLTMALSERTLEIAIREEGGIFVALDGAEISGIPDKDELATKMGSLILEAFAMPEVQAFIDGKDITVSTTSQPIANWWVLGKHYCGTYAAAGSLIRCEGYNNMDHQWTATYCNISCALNPWCTQICHTFHSVSECPQFKAWCSF